VLMPMILVVLCCILCLDLQAKSFRFLASLSPSEVIRVSVLEGHHVCLPCGGFASSNSKHKWFRQREGQKEEVIFTRFRNGTGKAEKDASRLSYINNALQITKLQPGDAGEYLCNRVLQAKLTV
uniref:Ig-like domain-containing protein n=1 Tax=Poecilia formosa TaxID=48698 RepID=A0A096LXG8_POEFO